MAKRELSVERRGIMPNIHLNEIKPILDKYGLNVKRVTIETMKQKKAVWWVDSNSGKYVLKKMPVSKGRLLFLLSAIEHLSDRGINIPPVCQTTDGKHFVEDGGHLYIVMKAVIGKPPSYDEPQELSIVMEGLAGFHGASTNFKPPVDADVRKHLGNWDEKYIGSISDLENFRESAANSKNDFELFYLNHCDYFIKEAKACLKLLRNPAYGKWLDKVRLETNLCHQDFAAGNLGLVDGKLYIYDLDSITIDLPARDLRKILNKTMKKRGQWDTELTKKMLSCYQKVNLLTMDEYSVVFTDVRFPHLFCGIANKYFTNREDEWSSAKYLRKLQEITMVEKSKEKIIKYQGEIINALI